MTKEILDTFKKTGSQENEKDPKIIVKFFTPWSSWTWYATEFDGDDTFFGLVDGTYKEGGSFSLSELKSVTGFGGLGIERDLYFGDKRISDVEPKHTHNYLTMKYMPTRYYQEKLNRENFKQVPIVYDTST